MKDRDKAFGYLPVFVWGENFLDMRGGDRPIIALERYPYTYCQCRYVAQNRCSLGELHRAGVPCHGICVLQLTLVLEEALDHVKHIPSERMPVLKAVIVVLIQKISNEFGNPNVSKDKDLPPWTIWDGR